MEVHCRDCEDLHQQTPAVTRIGKTPLCLRHWRARLGMPKAQENTTAIAAPAAAPEEGSHMAEKICGCGCGEKLRKDSTREYKMGHEPAGGGDTSPAPKRAKAAASSNGHFAVKLSVEGLDAVWNALPAEKKAELLGNL